MVAFLLTLCPTVAHGNNNNKLIIKTHSLFLLIGEQIVDHGGALLGGGSGARFLFFWLYDIVLTGLAAMLTAFFSPGVEGSGIPVSQDELIRVNGA